MNYQDKLQRLETIKAKAIKIDRETIAFYQQWHSGFKMAMKGQMEAQPETHTVAYIEGLEDALNFMQVKNLANFQ